MNFPFLDAKARLVRIMGTFDLATGHGDTMDELLDSLESELRDVLGHYREALKQRQWVGLTDEEIDEYLDKEWLGYSSYHDCFKEIIKWHEARLKEKNT